MTSFAPSDGARIAFDQEGAGPDVLLIHAGVTDRHMWDDVVPLLRDDYRVTRYDMRGFGETVEDDPGEWAPRHDLIAVMDAAGIDAACLVGVSMGGGAAINAALEYPERVSHVVPINPGVGGFDYQPDDWENEIEGRIEAAIEEERFDDCATLEMEMWLAGPHRALDAMGEGHRTRMREWLLRSYQLQPDWSRAARMDPPANDRLGEIDVPTLMVHGELDVASMAGVAARIASVVPNARLVTMADTAHLPPLEQPTQFVALLREFLAEN